MVEPKLTKEERNNFQIKKQEGNMLNDTQIVFQYCPVGPLEGVPDKIYLNKFGRYVNGETLGIHINEGGGNGGCMSILEQPIVYTN